MSPYELARGVYAQEPSRRTFAEDLEHHHVNGFVFSTPDYFVMGRPVIKMSVPVLILDPSFHFPREDVDCWHIYLFAGKISLAWEVLPWRMEWISLERRNDLRFYRLADLERLSAFPCT